ncbi:xanthine dehydrogenase [Microplitis demolitor]|uniref:xanthine dehydrogenase n=1 Tax=Microplitis demolitor TaxID=69319 RepID=UPI0004CD4ED2|nr:xanthine dehydrogenase [Microplitis demolitor]XP_008556719.1 xanthine dehydrogenase [Microplitis demolitor]XP_008556720.1 xanthine dehydrogenase [Microplitis demolitor]XP_014299159.1 xanthine dehydrogenase [Microplitis demolitor]XP_014299160.1 xanthine dehydrogenase [Microplitis demolitor]XP_014299161.1 xanthine dehydrogenase [Microplitis demolitor]XP_053596090.1 xanthine dehydrogenase [Microplitis demolitor]XP_053596091.1 xanthine dehydrogenase [Microplitis demolitor]
MGKPDDDTNQESAIDSLVFGHEVTKSKESSTLVFYVNGQEIQDSNVNPEWTLLYYIRNKLKLSGTKLGCAEGGCGACTVMVSRIDRLTGRIIHLAVNACLAPVCSMHGMAVTTVEGIGSTRTKLHPVQERIAKAHGSQCGFCTPGIVMSMYALLRTMPKPSMHDLEVAFQGNLCRCTGYRPIIEGFRTFTEEWEQSQLESKVNKIGNSCQQVCAMGEACCKKAFTSEVPIELINSNKFQVYDPTQEIIFPPKLKLCDDLDKEYLIIKGKEVTWYRPTTLKELLLLKKKHPAAKIVVGNTEVGVQVKFKHFVYPVLIYPTQIKEMRELTVYEDVLKVGSGVTLTEMEEALRDQIKIQPEYKTRIFVEIINMLHWFAGKQIRNVGAIGGNIMTGSPISDMVPVLMAAGTKLNVINLDSCRQIALDHTFFTGYRRNVMKPDEILVSLEVPFTEKFQYFVAYKQAKRRDDDIAIVNMALNVIFKENSNEILQVHLAYGGMAPITKLAVKTSQTMIGKKWDPQILESTYQSLIDEFPLSDNVPGGMVHYRRSLTLSLFLKGFIHIFKQLQITLPHINHIPKELLSASNTFRHKPPKSSQYFQVVPKNQSDKDLIGRPIVHVSAFKQVTGEAIYCDDIPHIDGELYMALVMSTKAHAKIIKIDATKALAIDGVVAFFSAKDIPEHNRWVGPVFHDEEVFVSLKVTSQGQSIGAIVAVDQITAQKAARAVMIEYEELEPILVSIEDAIKAESFMPTTPKSIKQGDVHQAFAESDHVLEGEVKMGGQEHFYLETHATLAIPKETDEIELYCSTQHPTEVQKLISHVLGISMNRITVRVKRMGGGFGGKESRGMLVALPAALAAYNLRKPVRCMLDRDEDMMISGARHPFMFKYKVGFTKDGLIKGVEIKIYNNGGYSVDLSVSVLERSMFHCENAYKFPVINVTGYACMTNLPSNTAFRGFGGPQGMFAAENIMWDIANYLGMEPAKVSEINLYKENDLTHYNQPLIGCSLQRCWQQCIISSNYHERYAAVKKFNQENRYRKRGISVIPTKFGIAFTALFLNQGGALVHIYHDGSVLISHGGTEMGQGLHTKMIQVASRILKVNPDKIHISETATDKVPNTSATAASAGSDLNGMAIINACNEILSRIEHIMKANPSDTWEQWISKAYFERISLSATGFYRTPDIGYSFDTNSGNPFNYFTYGVACSEVEVDCLTGDHQVLRTDIVMDLGDSLNPAIDIGQVEGGFIQGLGLFTLEELIFSPTGTLYSRGPGAYKIPGFADIPQEFNVSLLRDAPNPRAVFSSKAVGEPPLFLASSIFFAIKNAVQAARKDTNASNLFRLDSPATAARIRMACVDDLTNKFPTPDIKKAWNKIL